MANGASIPDWHVLDFFCDDADSCALTVLVRGLRFHIIADNEQVSSSTKSGKRYSDLVKKLRSGEKDERASTTSSDNPTETDSGIDVHEDKEPKQQTVDPEEELQHFMLEPLPEEFTKLSKTADEETLQEWYHGPTYFYKLEVPSNGDLSVTQLEAETDLTKRMGKLKPAMALPKSLTDRLHVPFYRASDLTVITTSDQPPGTPYHPCRVRRNDGEESFFLKIVDNNQPQPLKRELDILHQATELKLNGKINVPCLEGLVTFDEAEETKSGQKRIMGFLQTDIPEAKPLTSLLDPSIDQSKREHWAEEAERAKNVLHENDIIWADAKADNFVVNKHDKLWMIDFGGSFTEGWVDRELNETVEGDDMGTERIVNALEDPVANTYDPDEEGGGRREGKSAGVKGSMTFSPDREMRKRKRKESDEEEESDAEDSRKKAKRHD